MTVNLKNNIKIFLDKLPYIRTLRRRLDVYESMSNAAFPMGHFYSPIPSKEYLIKNESLIFNKDNAGFNGLNLNIDEQLLLFSELKQYYNEIHFSDSKRIGMRYYADNSMYKKTDGIFLYSIIRYLKPAKIIEIGSGFSSALILDTNDKFFKGRIKCFFIEPNPDRLLSLLNDNDKKKYDINKNCVQDIDIDFFKRLSSNDILFIDSSHISKIGSDVNYIFFNILPNLNKGVVIHFHDIFYPFEYPKEWVYDGITFNESYILKAFLQFNKEFKIVIFNSFLEYYFTKDLKSSCPEWMKDGSSIWLRKIRHSK